MTVLTHIHLVEVYNAGGVAKAAPLAFSSSLFLLNPSQCVNDGWRVKRHSPLLAQHDP